MPVKEVFAPHLNRKVKFGRKRPVTVGPHLKLSRYLDLAKLPAPPPSMDYSPAASASLSNVMLNDAEGDCVIAAGYHITGVATGNAGDLYVPSDTEINADYSAVGGYVPGDPSTDNGCMVTDALNYWTSHGFSNGTKLLGWLAVDGTSPIEYKTALWLFENLDFGIELPDAWVNPFPSGPGFTWGKAGSADPNNGHSICGVGYTSSGVTVCSWGLLGLLTDAAIAAYATSRSGGELYVLLTPDQLLKGQSKAPNGFAWADLIADFDRLGGNVPMPPLPTPQPTPSPAPPAAVVTLASAQSWMGSAFQGHHLLSGSLAAKIAENALAQNWPKSALRR